MQKLGMQHFSSVWQEAPLWIYRSYLPSFSTALSIVDFSFVVQVCIYCGLTSDRTFSESESSIMLVNGAQMPQCSLPIIGHDIKLGTLRRLYQSESPKFVTTPCRILYHQRASRQLLRASVHARRRLPRSASYLFHPSSYPLC